MALKVWLPLNGNLDNQGLSNLSFTNENVSNLVVDNNGKIGKCYSRPTKQTTGRIISDKTINLDNDFTMCCWANVSDGIAGANGLVSNHDHSSNTGVGINVKYISSTDFRISCSTGTGTGRTYESYYGTTNIKDTWHHLALTYDKIAKQLLLYVDGVVEYTLNNYLNASKEDYIMLFEWSTNYNKTSYRPAAKLNDVRIYDECLSQKQIKEISKGLVAHYKLDGPKANENLILRSDKITSGGQASGITRTYMDDGTLKVVSTSGNGNYCSIGFAENSNTNVGNKLSVGDTYTISCDIKVEEGTAFPTLFINSGNSYRQLGGPILKLNTWQRVYYTNTWNEPGTSYGNISLHLGFSSAIGTYYFKNFKLEKGNFTPWIPAPTDPMYTSLGYANDICTDVSGNGYTASKNGTFIFNTDSPRYSGCTKFDSGYLHKVPSPLNINSDAFTISCWFYPTQNATMCLINDRKAVGDGLAVFYLGGGIRFDTGSSYQWQVGTITVNAWNHVVVTWDKTAGSKKLYLNGNLVNTTTSYGTLAQIGDVFSIGNSSTNGAAGAGNQVYGSISDFRIYATALSADNILTMYKNSGIIDNKGNTYAYELCENNKNFSYPSSIVGVTTLGNGVYQVSHSGAYDGAYLPITNFTVGQKYKLTYYFQKIDGVLNWMGGHCTGYTISKYYLDGKEISYGYASNTSAVDYLNDEKIHFAEIYFTCNGGTTNDSFYIQPNRGIATAVEVRLFDIKFYGTDFPESEKFKITKNGLNVSYNFLEKEEKASITYNNNIKANSFIEM